jgi:hypothetical protein
MMSDARTNPARLGTPGIVEDMDAVAALAMEGRHFLVWAVGSLTTALQKSTDEVTQGISDPAN